MGFNTVGQGNRTQRQLDSTQLGQGNQTQKPYMDKDHIWDSTQLGQGNQIQRPYMGLKPDPKTIYGIEKLDPKTIYGIQHSWDKESPGNRDQGNIFQLSSAFERNKLARCLDTLSVRETITIIL